MLAVLPVVVAVLVVAGSASGAVAQTAAARSPQAYSGARGITHIHGLETQVLAAINNLRRERGVAPLRLSPALSAAASRHSLSMAEHGFFDHSSPDGSTLSKRVEAAAPNGSRWSLGENLAWASPQMSARRALRLWLASPPHRENLLSPAWREIGLGAVHALVGGVFQGREVTILTVDFGVRR